LKNIGFTDNEIMQRGVEVTDKAAREYGSDLKKEDSRYIVKGLICIKTANVDLVSKALSQITAIIEKGVIIHGNPEYYFTKFLDLRPQMIAGAIKNAQDAASQFAQVSCSKVGKIKNANQGNFTISPVNNSNECSRGCSYDSETSSIEKKIRIVSTIVFYLE